MTSQAPSSRPVFATIISYLFHPLLTPTIGLWFIFQAHSYISFIVPLDLQKALYVVVFITTFIFPVTSSLLLLAIGRIQSLEMKTPEERRLPFLLTAIYYSVGYYMLTTKVPLPAQLNLVLLGANISVVLTMLINLKWKISAHTIGIGGLFGALLGFSYQLRVNILVELMLVLLIAGLVGYARLRLSAHTQSQVYAGYIVGFLCEFLLFVYL